LHHVAYPARDIEATLDFYENGLGIPLAYCENHRSGKGWFKHFFFDIGGGEFLAFFQVEDVGENADYKTEVSTGLGLPRWVVHVAFKMTDVAQIAAVKRRAAARGIPVYMEANHGWCHSLYFVDPNGIMVEFCTTTVPAALVQTHDQALAVLRQDPAQIGEETRKDETKRNIILIAPGEQRPV
jgi:catechol 2,3-dioxygenase-like lactoylglutathione lyase family enzyme